MFLSPYVLVIDDDPTIGRMVRRILIRAGFAVGILERGRDAIEHTKTWVPDLMLVDMQLGDMRGDEVVRAIRERFGERAPPMIAMSGDGRGHVDGCVASCSKPFTMDGLVEVVRTHVRSRS